MNQEEHAARMTRLGLRDGRILTQHLADRGLTHCSTGGPKHDIIGRDGGRLFTGTAHEVWLWLADGIESGDPAWLAKP